MTHVDRNRLLLSGFVTLALHAVSFPVTERLELFKPRVPPSYSGPIIVEVFLEPVTSIPDLLPEPVEPAEIEEPISEPPVETEALPETEPIVETEHLLETIEPVVEEPEIIPVPETIPEPIEVPVEIEMPVETEQTEITSALIPGETSPVDSTQQEGEAIGEVVEETSVSLIDTSEFVVAESPTESVAAEVEAFEEGVAVVDEQTEAGQGESEVIGPGAALESVAETETQTGTGEDVGEPQAELPREFYEAGEDESVSAPRLDLASVEAFQSVSVETPTVEGSGSRFIYEDDESPVQDPRDKVAIEAETAGRANPIIGNRSLLAAVDETLASVGPQDGSTPSVPGSPTGTGTAENGEAASPDDSTEESEEEIIEADSVDELRKARGIENLIEPVLRPGILGDGQRHLTPIIMITITWEGIVKNVVIDSSSGISEVDKAIRTALRKWKFKTAPEGHPNVTVRFPYQIEAT